jgi:hypothetical protein
MYKILALDGKEYGPVSLVQLKQWITEGRVNAQTRVQETGAPTWKIAGEFPELAPLLFTGTPPPVGATTPSPITSLKAVVERRKGLAIASFVLGLASFVLCLSVITGIPAIICGHIARGQARRLPDQYGGAGFASAGLILGYLSVLYTIMLAVIMVFEVVKHRHPADVHSPTTEARLNVR